MAEETQEVEIIRLVVNCWIRPAETILQHDQTHGLQLIKQVENQALNLLLSILIRDLQQRQDQLVNRQIAHHAPPTPIHWTTAFVSGGLMNHGFNYWSDEPRNGHHLES